MTPQPRRRRLEVEDIGDVTVVNFVDKKILDEQNIQVIGEQLFSLVDELGRRKVLLNFKNVEFLSSAALGKLITMNRKLQSAGGKLVLCEIDPQIYEVFEITKLNKLFTIHKSEQDGLQPFCLAEAHASPRVGFFVRGQGCLVMTAPAPCSPCEMTIASDLNEARRVQAEVEAALRAGR